MYNIWIPGSRGFVGSNIKKYFNNFKKHYTEGKEHSDLTTLDSCMAEIEKYKADYVINLVGRVGGITDNIAYPAEFFYQNMACCLNIIHSAWKHETSNFIQLGSACSYAKDAEIPFKEYDLLKGLPEPTNEAYAVAKRATLSMLQAYNRQYGFKFLYVVVGNLYGPHDNMNERQSHVIPAIFKKFIKADIQNEKKIVMWGSGKPTRDFLFAPDLCTCLEKLIDVSEYEPINISSGEEVSIKDLTYLIREILGFRHIDIEWDTSKPDGQTRRCLDLNKIGSIIDLKTTTLIDGLKQTKNYILENSNG